MDPDAQTAEVLTLGELDLEPVATYVRGQELRSTLLEGLNLNLSEVL